MLKFLIEKYIFYLNQNMVFKLNTFIHLNLFNKKAIVYKLGQFFSLGFFFSQKYLLKSVLLKIKNVEENTLRYRFSRKFTYTHLV